MLNIVGVLGLAVSTYGIFLYLTGKDIYREKFIGWLNAPRPSFSTYYQTYLQKGLDKLYDWFGAPFSAKALTLNTFFAICYAFSFFAVSWILGQSGKIGISYIMPPFSTIRRILNGILFILLIYIIRKCRKIDSRIENLLSKRIPSKVVPLIYRLSASVLVIILSLIYKHYILLLLLFFTPYMPALGVAFAVAGALIEAGTIVFIVAIAISFVFTDATKAAAVVTVAVAIAVGSTGPLALIVALGFTFGALCLAIKKMWLASYLFNVYLICLSMIGLSLEWKFVKIETQTIFYFFFLIILPFINGFMDFVSLGISRILGKKIYDDITRKTLKTVLFHFSLDLAAAVLLLVFLIFAICFGMQLFNIFVAKKTELVIDLPNLIESAKQAPFGPDGLWITLMLLSTLVPTFAHFVIAFTGIFTIYITPNLREKLADLLEQERNALPALYYTGKTFLGLLFAAGLWGIVGYGVNHMANFVNMLSKIAYWSINLAEKIPH